MNILRSIILCLVLVGFAGCDDGDSTTEVPSPGQTEEQLMLSYKEIYENLEEESFDAILHPDFQFILLPGTIENWGFLPGATFDHDAITEIHDHLLGGLPGVDYDENIIHPLVSIEIKLLDRRDPWTTVSVNNPDYSMFPETRKATYMVKMQLYDGAYIFEINQNVVFFAQSEDDEGIEKFLLRGIKCLTEYPSKGTIAAEYGHFLAMFK